MIENTEQTAVFDSGLKAIDATIQQFTQHARKGEHGEYIKGDKIVVIGSIYGGSYAQMMNSFDQTGRQFYHLPISEFLEKGLPDDAVLVFFEACNNPTLKIIPIPRVVKEAKRVINDEIMAMHQVCDNIDESFERAVGIIDKSNKVVVTGVGKSGSIARKIAATFSSIGVPSIFLHPVDALHGDIGQVQAGDSALFLSKSGSTVDIIKLMPYLVKRNIPIISIVRSEEHTSELQSH